LGTLQIKNVSDGIEIGVEQVGVGVQRDLGAGVSEHPRMMRPVRTGWC
jgi:hypothetical protein